MPLFQQERVGAVQLRKAIANGTHNFWTRGQVAEMAFDAYCQRQRVAVDGIGELRGNGQFVRRTALEECGGWNEETITDDLDLTLKLHVNGWDVPLMMTPYVREEGVTGVLSLWHQRNRWAEGGYQRYLDYWRLITPRRLGWSKAWDLAIFLDNSVRVANGCFPGSGASDRPQPSADATAPIQCGSPFRDCRDGPRVATEPKRFTIFHFGANAARHGLYDPLVTHCCHRHLADGSSAQAVEMGQNPTR